MKKKKEAGRNAFHQLKKAVMSAPVLAYLDPNKEYLLETDASNLCWELCCPRSSQMEDIALWLSGVECYMEQRSVTIVLNLSFWP